jgi:hypothetical protein
MFTYTDIFLIGMGKMTKALFRITDIGTEQEPWTSRVRSSSAVKSALIFGMLTVQCNTSAR